MTTLLMSSRHTEDDQALWRAAIGRGWSVARARGIRLPEIDDDEIVIYVEALYAQTIAGMIGRHLLEPSEDWLVRVPHGFRRREVQLMTLGQARAIQRPSFVKPPNDKLFAARVYESGACLPLEFEDDMSVLVVDPVQWESEFRCFCLDGKVMTLSPYLRSGVHAQNMDYQATDNELCAARKFAEQVLAATLDFSPRAVVIDVGQIAGLGWAVVEANAAWGSGIYGCNPNLVLDVIRHATLQSEQKGAMTMGTSHGDFTKYPRTPHLFGSKGTDDDKHLGEAESKAFIADESLIVEEKIDGTNVGIHFSESGEMVLQCRGHLITEGMHPQYDLFKQWAAVKRHVLEEQLQSRFILFGEWAYARHSIHYRKLTHYFFEFDIYDKEQEAFLDLERRLSLLEGTGIQTVPVVHTGTLDRDDLEELIGPSEFDSHFENPITKRPDNLMEGLYLRTEANGAVSGRAKFVRPEFVEKIKQSTHWQHQQMVPNLLADDVDIWG